MCHCEIHRKACESMIIVLHARVFRQRQEAWDPQYYFENLIIVMFLLLLTLLLKYGLESKESSNTTNEITK